MSYKEEIDYLNSFINFEKLPDQQFNTRVNDLEQFRILLDRMGNPHRNYPIIHIAGTKGKGSTAMILGSILKAAGYKVGVYTSPHLVSIRERIIIDGKRVLKAFLETRLKAVRSAIMRVNGNLSVSYRTLFEVITAAAFDHFSRRKVDIAVIEAGLGGRLDATNVVDPILSILTPIGLDHTAILGDTISEIAADKAHIIKSGIPIVTAWQHEEALIQIKKRAGEMSVQLSVAPATADLFHSYKYEYFGGRFYLTAMTNSETLYRIKSFGMYQLDNMSTVLTAVEQLRHRGFTISAQNIVDGIRLTKIYGRMQFIRGNPQIFLDGAHNEMAMDAVRKSIDGMVSKPLRVVISSLKSKPLMKMIMKLSDRTTKFYLAPICFPKGKTYAELRAEADEYGINYQLYQDIPSAFDAARNEANRGEIILATGSLYLVGEVIRHMKGLPRPPENGLIDNRV